MPLTDLGTVFGLDCITTGTGVAGNGCAIAVATFGITIDTGGRNGAGIVGSADIRVPARRAMVTALALFARDKMMARYASHEDWRSSSGTASPLQR